MSVIDIIHSFSKYLPTIKAPEKPLGTNDKLKWTGLVLVLYFMMYQTTIFGIHPPTEGLGFLQTITASNIGSLLTTGIGPLVLASIFLQLFAGAGVINLDLKKREDKQKFQETQKVLAIILALVEAMVFVVFARLIVVDTTIGIDPVLLMLLAIFQITLGSVLVLFLDELVTKYGLGSGISLFIAAGVSFAIFAGVVALIFGDSGDTVMLAFSEGGAEALPQAIKALAPFLFTIMVFLVVVYAEGIKVEIPIAFQRVRGMVPKLPLKFFYVSNIPVIFASAMIINIQLFGGGLLAGQYWQPDGTPQEWNDILDSGYDIAKHGVLPIIGFVGPNNRLSDGLLYLLSPPRYTQTGIDAQIDLLLNAKSQIFGIPEWLHAIMYIILLGIVSVMFGLFWVETSNMDAKAVAGQLSDSGIQIPGFRRDPRMLESILNKHIFPLTVMGSFSVGLLAGIADLTGALGSGTGILLTVGILYRMYEQLEQQKAFDAYPTLSKVLLGE